jgi:hypothetical protein
MTSRSVILRMRNVAEQRCREHQHTHFMFNAFVVENRAVYEIIYKKYGKARQATDCNITRRMRNACWITGHRDIRRNNNTNCFCTDTKVTQMRLDVRMTRTLPVLLTSISRESIM